MNPYEGNYITYELMKPGEEDAVIDLILTTFNEFVAPGYVEQGITEFCNYTNAEKLKARGTQKHCTLVARQNEKIIGAMEVRENNHIALFFVKKGLQKMGVGKNLLKYAMETCFEKKQNLKKITVNASPNAVNAYKEMGFTADDAEQCINGIRMVPMSLKMT